MKAEKETFSEKSKPHFAQLKFGNFVGTWCGCNVFLENPDKNTDKLLNLATENLKKKLGIKNNSA